MTSAWIYLLPSETTKVIVKYHPKWMISCVLPKSTKSIFAIKHDYDNDLLIERKLFIEVPDLIISHSFPKPWIKDSKLEPYFNINAINVESSNDIKTRPFRLANVYSSGSICFGEVGRPSNLRRANNYFWASPFNEDNCPFLHYHYLNCDTRDHDHDDEKRIIGQNKTLEHYSAMELDQVREKCSCCQNWCGCSCQCDLTECFYEWISNYSEFLSKQEYIINTSLFCGEKCFTYSKPLSALFISNCQDILDKVPMKSHHKDLKDTFVIGIAKQQSDQWEVQINNLTMLFSNKEIEVI